MKVNLLLSVKLLPGASGFKSNGSIKYPQGLDYKPLSSIEVFSEVIKSYSNIEFSKVYFLIDVDGLESVDIILIESIIIENIKAEVLEVKFERPSNKLKWIKFIENIDDSRPYLVCMNHDMLFNCRNSEFHSLINNFEDQLLNSDSLLTYCHIPEMVSWASNNLQGYQFSFSEGRWESNSTRFWLDGIYMMSRGTLLKIFNLIIDDGPSYLPRFDWPGVAFNELKFKTIVVPVNLFTHYDGSTHVLCSRLKENFRIIFNSSNSYYPINIFKEFIEIFHIAFAFWFLLPRRHNRRAFRKHLIKSFNFFIEGKKLCSVEISKSDYDYLLGLIMFYEAFIYDNSKSDSQLITFSFKSYVSYFYRKIKIWVNL